MLGELDPRVRVRLGIDKVTGRARGFAFAEFGDDATAASAIRRYDGMELRGRRLRVNDAADKPPPRTPRAASPGSTFTGPRTPPGPFGGRGSGGRPPYSPQYPPPELPPEAMGFGPNDDLARGGGPWSGNRKGGSRRNLRARKRSLRW